MSELFDTLQTEFCPPLDSSLLAALLAEIETDAQGNTITPSYRQVEDFKATLRELSSLADESQLDELSNLDITSNTEDTTSTPEFYQGNTATTICTTFQLTIVADILTTDSIRELEERGLDLLDSQEASNYGSREDDISWKKVESKKKSKKAVSRKSNRSKTITLVDIRQRQHALPRISAETSRPNAAPDPWTQISSLATLLAAILTPHPASLFRSYFHSPKHASPYLALVACLESISTEQVDQSFSDEYMDTLYNIVEIMGDSPECEDVDHMRLIHDVELSLQATCGRGEDALDLVRLLRELDSDSNQYLALGIYHSAPQTPRRSAPIQPKRPTLPNEPPPIPPPPQLRSSGKPTPPPPAEKDQSQWQTVPQRPPANKGPHPLAANIPAYANVNKVKGSGNTFGKGGKGDVGELSEPKQRAEENMRKFLRQATRMWQKGNSKSRGGEIAYYFAERAREFQELARAEGLNAARQKVEAKRRASNNPYEVDLHGTTVYEACVIVKEILQSLPTSQSKSLKVITGRGLHSVNQVGVLKPALRKELVSENWDVGSWEGGLVIRGKQRT
ncbi:hypothetical protein H0H93_000672 [Arthromyces matolae]|nr:hypothetical protein H0H93_000672 [Arthromyces matolae]